MQFSFSATLKAYQQALCRCSLVLSRTERQVNKSHTVIHTVYAFTFSIFSVLQSVNRPWHKHSSSFMTEHQVYVVVLWQSDKCYILKQRRNICELRCHIVAAWQKPIFSRNINIQNEHRMLSRSSRKSISYTIQGWSGAAVHSGCHGMGDGIYLREAASLSEEVNLNPQSSIDGSQSHLYDSWHNHGQV